MATKVDPVEKLKKEIVLGRHDDELSGLVDVIMARARAAARPRWRIELPDLTLTEDDLTVGEACDIEDAMRGTPVGRDAEGRTVMASWLTIDPERSGEEARTVLAVLYRHRHQITEAEAEALAGKLNARQLRLAVKREIVTGEAGPFVESPRPSDT